jgi:3',5'-cyclic AMP phosphodiesterase CpdA
MSGMQNTLIGCALLALGSLVFYAEQHSIKRELSLGRRRRRLRSKDNEPPFIESPAEVLSRRKERQQNASELFRFALVTDTHVWPAAAGRNDFTSRSDASPIRDGLLVRHSPQIYSAMLQELGRFAAGGGAFAVHAGDAVCGGNNFHSPANEYERALRMLAEEERAILGRWPIHHVAGNHDLHPKLGGLSAWQRELGNQTGAPRPDVAYRSLRHRGWRILLLDTASAVHFDTDGHGLVDAAQLGWLQAELDASAAGGERVLLVGHQLLVQPREPSGAVVSWLEVPVDMVENANQVLNLLSRYPHVRLSLHGHVHANSLTTYGGIAFVTTSSASEYPMQWREVIVRECEIEMRTRTLPVASETLAMSRQREAGRGDPDERNRAKLGGVLENHLLLSVCTPTEREQRENAPRPRRRLARRRER